MPSEVDKKESYCPRCSKITTQTRISGSTKWKCRGCGNKVSWKNKWYNHLKKGE